jgi:hypothetical protein
MRTATTMYTYALAPAAVFGGAWAAGAVAGPLGDTASPSGTDHTTVTSHDAPAAESARPAPAGPRERRQQLPTGARPYDAGHSDPEPLRFRIPGSR